MWQAIANTALTMLVGLRLDIPNFLDARFLLPL